MRNHKQNMLKKHFPCGNNRTNKWKIATPAFFQKLRQSQINCLRSS